MARINSFRELKDYQNAFQAAMMILELTKAFPREVEYSMTDQMRRLGRAARAERFGRVGSGKPGQF